MALSFLTKAKNLAPENSVKFHLHRWLSGPDPARSLKTLHASELTREGGICPRMYALADLTRFKPDDKWLTTSERMTFQIGRDQERNLVQWFGEMGKAVCHWECVACQEVHPFQLKPEDCQSCGAKAFIPREVRFESAISGASCGADMLLNLGGPKLRLVEIKTMDKDQFKTLQAPLAEHRWRTNLYLRILAESTQSWASQVDSSEATILYVSKGGYGCEDADVKKWGLPERFSPFKEYRVTRDDSQTNDISLRAQTVKAFREGQVGVPCGVCPTAMVKRAQSCPLKFACFSGEFPSDHDWRADA